MDPAISGEGLQLLEDAVQRAEKRGVSLRAIEGVAEKLPFENSSFDAVVSTLVFCSVRDPTAALREVTNVSARDRDHTVHRPSDPCRIHRFRIMLYCFDRSFDSALIHMPFFCHVCGAKSCVYCSSWRLVYEAAYCIR